MNWFDLETKAQLDRRDTIYIIQPLHTSKIWHKDIFYAEFKRFDFRVFFFLDRFP